MNAAPEVAHGSPAAGGAKKAKKPSAPTVTPSKDRVKLGKATRVVYEGPRGGKYVKKDGKLVPLAAAKPAKKPASKKPAPKKK